MSHGKLARAPGHRVVRSRRNLMAGRGTRVGGWLKWLISSLSTIAGTIFVTAGVLFLGYSLGAYFEVVPGSRVSVPPPVALSQPRPTATVVPATVAPAVPTP